MYTSDKSIPTKRVRLDRVSGGFVDSPIKELFLRGPIPMKWLERAAALPGKSLHLALALWWLDGVVKVKPFKLTGKVLDLLHVSRDATDAGLRRLEQEGLIRVDRATGRRPLIAIVKPSTVGQATAPATATDRP
jgi:hypothetical protein